MNTQRDRLWELRRQLAVTKTYYTRAEERNRKQESGYAEKIGRLQLEVEQLEAAELQA